jgi:hypothetical protein
MKPDIHRVRTHWIRDFIVFQPTQGVSAAPALADGPDVLGDPEHHHERL